MNRLEHILTITAEECNEVAQRITKALRFGISNIEEGQPYNNLERIMHEYNDLVAMLEMLENELDGGIGLSDYHNHNSNSKEEKKSKVEKYFEISKQEGTLD
jgi:NTP pyrophosphatase (non-canonical NTP hydrolase)